MDAVLRRHARVRAEDAYAWFTDFADADLRIQRALKEQRVHREGGRLWVERTLDFGEGPFRIRFGVTLDPPRGYTARIAAKEGEFDLGFAFVPAAPGRRDECDIVVTVHDAPDAPTASEAFRAGVLRNVSQNLDDYVPAMEKELARAG